jgi:hypothetical protein
LAVHRKGGDVRRLSDFDFWRIEPERASLNGGFGRAWLLSRADLRRAFGHS